MTKVIFGNHSSVIVPRQDRDSICKFYCDVLGGKITKAEDDRDFIRLGENFYIAFMYGDVPDESEYLRSARSVWLELKADYVEELRLRIVESGLVRKLEIPDPHLYFQAPGGQCLRLVGIDEDLTFYEGAGGGPNVARVKEALKKGGHDQMSTPTKIDYRLPTDSNWVAPRAVADGAGGTIIAVAEIGASPERVFQALTTDDVERWWGHPDYYRQTGWKADLRVCGEWSVTVRFTDGNTNGGTGEFAEIDAPRKLVMTRKFEKHPLQGHRETTICYRLEPVPNGTRLTMREEGYVGRSAAAYGNAEHWERVLTWLAAYFSGERRS